MEKEIRTIVKYLKNQKKKGIVKVDILSIHLATGIDARIIDKVMDELEKEELVEEIE